MKIKYNILSPLLMTMLAICCLWIVTDMAYGVRMWELGASAWFDRIKALALIMINIILASLFFNSLATIFFDRNKENKLLPKIIEYFWVILFIIVTLNISL